MKKKKKHNCILKNKARRRELKKQNFGMSFFDELMIDLIKPKYVARCSKCGELSLIHDKRIQFCHRCSLKYDKQIVLELRRLPQNLKNIKDFENAAKSLFYQKRSLGIFK